MELRPLQQITVLPDRYSDRSRALTHLKRIDHVEIRDSVKRNGNRHYVIDIYYKLSLHRIPKQQHRLLKRSPLAKTEPKPTCANVPDVTVLRRFSEFSNVSDEMYFHAHSGHVVTSCDFCTKYVDFMTLSATQPGVLMKVLHNESRVRRLLERFLNEVLQMTVDRVKAFGGQDCLGQEQVPILLLEFLLPQEAAPDDAEAINMTVQGLRELRYSRSLMRETPASRV